MNGNGWVTIEYTGEDIWFEDLLYLKKGDVSVLPTEIWDDLEQPDWKVVGLELDKSDENNVPSASHGRCQTTGLP